MSRSLQIAIEANTNCAINVAETEEKVLCKLIAFLSSFIIFFFVNYKLSHDMILHLSANKMFLPNKHKNVSHNRHRHDSEIDVLIA